MTKKVLVIGLGVSGKGAAQFLKRQGYQVIGADRNPEEIQLEIEVFSDQKVFAPFDFDLVILSPGIPRSHPLSQEARKRGVEVIGEAELAFRHMKNRCIGITGTNGKTTLVSLIAHVLNYGGIKAKALGNIGESLAKYLLSQDEEEILVVELSSFQLETMQAPSLEIGVITNITPDHLDRYSSFEEYRKTKCHIISCIKPSGILIYDQNIDVDISPNLNFEIKREIIGADSYLQLTKNGGYSSFQVDPSAKFAFAIVEKFGITAEVFLAAYGTFKKPSHRIEYVRQLDGVTFYNDSKGTTPESVLFAIKQIRSPIILIAGGLNKGGHFTIWKEACRGRVKSIFAIGQAAPLLLEELGESFPVFIKEDLKSAFTAACGLAKNGDTVLLSPGCASFDQFKNYMHRGDVFKELVNGLTPRR